MPGPRDEYKRKSEAVCERPTLPISGNSSGPVKKAPLAGRVNLWHDAAVTSISRG